MSDYLDFSDPLPTLEELNKDGGKLLVLEILRRMPYDEYRETIWWQGVRDETWKRCGGRCRWCGKRGFDVHHMTYGSRGRETENDTALLCRECHTLFHENWMLKVRREGERQFREN